MDMSQARLKQRQGLEPNQRRIRHIHCIQARNLTFTRNANQKTLASVLCHSSGSQYQSITSSLEPPSTTSSPTKSYFRPPWRSYHQGIQKVRGPGSDAGSTSASDSGRASSVIKEPIARLSAGIKATMFSTGYSHESGYTFEAGSTPGASSSKTKTRYRASTDLSISKSFSNDGQYRFQQHLRQIQQGEDPSSLRRVSTEWTAITNSPSSFTPSKEQHLFHSKDALTRNNKDFQNQSASLSPIGSQSVQPNAGAEESTWLPPFVTKLSEKRRPILLDTYFTLHNITNDAIIYTSETVMGSNNPKYSPLEEHQFTDPAKRRSNNVTIRIWAGHCGSDFYPLLEWRVDLCCLRFIGKELRDLPTSLPNNTILFGFHDGFYTAPDEGDTVEHAFHASVTAEPTIVILGSGSGGLVQSYSYDSVMRLNNLHECIADTKRSRDEVKHNIELALNKEDAPMTMLKRRSEYTERLWHLQRQVGHELNVLEQAQDRAAALKKEHSERRKALEESRERGQTQEMYLEENLVNLVNSKESLYHTLKEYSTKRTELIATLFTIFPITESETNPGLLKICNVPLPNSVYTGQDEDLISIGLGYTSHLVTMLAHYLCVPLRYPITPMGSRASIFDPVSLLIGPKEFPLYGKGQERNRFEYGVFLLNKNIEQLMNSQGLQFMDLRQTLPNLRYLMEILLTSSPSQSTLYRSKYINRRKQDRSEQSRQTDFIVLPVEQHGYQYTSSSNVLQDGSVNNEDNQQGEGLRPRAHTHERNPSLSKPNSTSDRSSLIREYDPIEGDYMLVLDNAATKSSRRNRKGTNGSEISSSHSISTAEHTDVLKLDCSLMAPKEGHHRISAGISSTIHHHHQLHQDYALSTSFSGTEDDNESTDDPAFRDWASEAPHISVEKTEEDEHSNPVLTTHQDFKMINTNELFRTAKPVIIMDNPDIDYSISGKSSPATMSESEHESDHSRHGFAKQQQGTHSGVLDTTAPPQPIGSNPTSIRDSVDEMNRDSTTNYQDVSQSSPSQLPSIADATVPSKDRKQFIAFGRKTSETMISETLKETQIPKFRRSKVNTPPSTMAYQSTGRSNVKHENGGNEEDSSIGHNRSDEGDCDQTDIKEMMHSHRPSSPPVNSARTITSGIFEASG